MWNLVPIWEILSGQSSVGGMQDPSVWLGKFKMTLENSNYGAAVKVL
jgi:hypothetical protein